MLIPHDDSKHLEDNLQDRQVGAGVQTLENMHSFMLETTEHHTQRSCVELIDSKLGGDS